jgi:signal transduction histidine kinase/HAMP domain-containing protein
MKRFLTSIYFKIGVIIVIVEVFILTLIGTIYLNRLFIQIDQRVLERSQLLGNLIKANLVRIVSINDPEAMRLLVGEEIVDVFLASPDQTVFYSHDRSLVGKSIQNVAFANVDWFDESDPTETIEKVSDEQGSYIINVVPISLGTGDSTSIDFFLYTRINTTESETEKRGLVILLAIGTVATIISTSIIIIVAFNLTLLRRIRTLVAVMRQVEEGNLSVQVTGNITDDELGILERGANSTITQLNNLFETLEQRVANRTRDLKAATDVSRQVTTVLNMDALLPSIVELTKNTFGFYHVSIFLYDEASKMIRLAAGAGDVGEKMLQESKQFSIDDVLGIVPTSARSREVVIIQNVTQFETYFPNPLLPETRSEAAFPMLYGNRLIGILDLQSTEEDGFSDEVLAVLQSLTDQLAVAVRNAQLFELSTAARQEAERADRVKSAFLASMSHELRTPLNAIINFAKFLRRGVPGPVNAEQTELVTAIAESGHLLLNLINDVLDMSKIEAGSLRLFTEDNIDIREILQAAIRYTQPMLAEKPVQLCEAIPDDLPLLTGDRKRLLQIVLNVLTNACKFTHEGSINVTASVEEHHLLVRVEDTGSGIALEDYDNVFTAFKQTESGLRQGGGTGLGMPICKKLVEAHNGLIWFDSEPGKGTTFFIKIPVPQVTRDTNYA